EGRLLARLRLARLHPRAARFDGADRAAAGHRARRAGPRLLLRRRRDRRAQPRARRHAQRADVRAGAAGRGHGADDEHLLDLPGLAVGVPGTPGCERRLSRADQRDARRRGPDVREGPDEQELPLAARRGDRARRAARAGAPAADRPARRPLLRLLHRPASRSPGDRRRAPARDVPRAGHRGARRHGHRLRRDAQVLRLSDHHDEQGRFVEAGGAPPGRCHRRRRRLPRDAVPAVSSEPRPAAAARRAHRRPRPRHARPAPPPARRSCARAGTRSARPAAPHRQADGGDRLDDGGRGRDRQCDRRWRV
ncbi:MAG: Heterodisulfide reductase subunit B-like protein @ Putative succinate dehydrogenase subunit, partial [uncultured Solirubrobacteraceae bacterium]